MSIVDQVYSEFEKFSTASADVHLYALVDHSGMPGIVQQLSNAHYVWRSLFHGSKEENAITVAPILAPMETSRANIAAYRMLKWICEHGTYSSSLLLLASSLSMEEMARRLTSRIDAVLPDDTNVILRYFDARIFAELTTVLDDTQNAAFLSPAQQWWYVDRRGALQSVPATFASQDKWIAPLALTSAQQNRLIDASEPDQIAELLQNTVPEEYSELPYQDRFDFILRHSQTAHDLGINTTHEKSFYCALALLYGESFAAEPAWENGLAQVQSGKLTLQKLVEQMEEKSD